MHSKKSYIPKNFFIILAIAIISFSLFVNVCTIKATAESKNIPPIANGGNVTTAKVGETVYFSALGSKDPDGEIVLYEWDFDGDGIYDWNSTKNGTTTHIYKKPMAYNATLRVTDNEGAFTTDVYYVLIYSEDGKKEINPTVKAILTFVGIGEIIFGILLLLGMFKLKKEEE